MPTDNDVDLADVHNHETQCWRCRKCCQERNDRHEFAEECEFDLPPNPVPEGEYPVEDVWTRRPLA